MKLTHENIVHLLIRNLCITAMFVGISAFESSVSLASMNFNVRPRCPVFITSKKSLQQARTWIQAHYSSDNYAEEGDKSPSDYSSSNRNIISLNVTYEGRSCTIYAHEGESVLSALERSQAGRYLCLPMMPQDCRKGSCMTCAGRHRQDSKKSSLSFEGADNDDGSVSPQTTLSQEMLDMGYVLTCSSFVTGRGVELDLGLKEDIWREAYVTELQRDSKKIGREVVAKSMRLASERNIARWMKDTEISLKRSFEFE